MKLEFSQQILEKYTDIKFCDIHPVGAGMFHVDGWTDRQTAMMNLIVTFSNFANVSKSCWNLSYYMRECVVHGA
jgi:hypothetical protein